MNKLYNDVVFVGLTGQSGAGKTTVGQYLIDSGFGVIDCDTLSRRVTSDGSACLSDLVETFSPSILNPDGTLNRRALGMIVFSNTAKLEQLNTIIFPYILDVLHANAKQLIEAGHTVVVFDAPTLFESKLDKSCDIILSVVCPLPIRRARIIARDGITAAEADARLASQLSEGYFVEHSDILIQNDDDSDALAKQLYNAKETILQYKKLL